MPDRKPNLFIIGAPKCGTSALAAYLSEHPQIFICEPKEPFYWSSDYPGLQKRHGIESLQIYQRLFERAGPRHVVLGEGSTNYLRSEVAIKKIREFNPDAKFVVMLRNPVEVVHAFHSEVYFSRIENEPNFEEAWRMQDSRRKGESLPVQCEAPQFLQYADVASYAPQIERFYDLVPAEQRLVIVFDDFKSDNAKTFKEVQEFLGVDYLEKKHFERVNASHTHRSQFLAKLVLDPPPSLRPIVETARKIARKYKGGWIDRAKHWFRKPMKRTPLSDEFKTELEDYFREDVRALSSLLERDLMHWVGENSTATSECKNDEPELVEVS